MTTLNETQHRAEFLLHELPGHLSRVVGTLTGGNFQAGTVLGRVTADGKYTEHDPAAGDGTETAVAVLHGNVDASTADQEAVIVYRDAAVTDGELVFIDGISAGDRSDAIDALFAVGIHAR